MHDNVIIVLTHIRSTHRLHIEQWCARGGFDFWHLWQNGSGVFVAVDDEVITTSSISTAAPPSDAPVVQIPKTAQTIGI